MNLIKLFFFSFFLIGQVFINLYASSGSAKKEASAKKVQIVSTFTKSIAVCPDIQIATAKSVNPKTQAATAKSVDPKTIKSKSEQPPTQSSEHSSSSITTNQSFEQSPISIIAKTPNNSGEQQFCISQENSNTQIKVDKLSRAPGKKFTGEEVRAALSPRLTPQRQADIIADTVIKELGIKPNREATITPSVANSQFATFSRSKSSGKTDSITSHNTPPSLITTSLSSPNKVQQNPTEDLFVNFQKTLQKLKTKFGNLDCFQEIQNAINTKNIVALKGRGQLLISCLESCFDLSLNEDLTKAINLITNHLKDDNPIKISFAILKSPENNLPQLQEMFKQHVTTPLYKITYIKKVTTLSNTEIEQNFLYYTDKFSNLYNELERNKRDSKTATIQKLLKLFTLIIKAIEYKNKVELTTAKI